MSLGNKGTTDNSHSEKRKKAFNLKAQEFHMDHNKLVTKM